MVAPAERAPGRHASVRRGEAPLRVEVLRAGKATAATTPRQLLVWKSPVAGRLAQGVRPHGKGWGAALVSHAWVDMSLALVVLMSPVTFSSTSKSSGGKFKESIRYLK